MACWELLAPRRNQNIPRRVRWPNNIGLVAFNTLLLRVVMPMSAVGLAQAAQSQDWGLLHHLPLPTWLALLLGIIVLDLAIYLQHIMFHAVPGLWRLHRMHHADLEFDVTTGSRFHPLEIILSMLIKLLVIAALGPSAVAVLIFEIILNAVALFNHANAKLPLIIDRALRKLIVTPDMHRVHHSISPHEANSNFGFNLSLWDRYLGTYRAQPENGHDGMTIGIDQFRSTRDLGLDRMLIQPFKDSSGNYSINRPINHAANSQTKNPVKRDH
ncbi:MAG: sterol desaturase family protein [Porticoccaceae bacterium]|nr:sterol desaturase family protein [Porticoccaceae bacterium]